MPGVAQASSKRETSIEPHVSSMTENVSAVLEKSPSQPVKLPLFNPSSNKIFNEMERHAMHSNERNEDIQNCKDESRDNFALLSVHSEVMLPYFSLNINRCHKSKFIYPRNIVLNCSDKRDSN